MARVLADGGILPWVFGHCSARLLGSDRIYIIPHVHWEGKVIQEITADDIRAMDLNGNPLDCESLDIPEERFFHVELYKARPDICGLIYGHPRMSCAFAAAGRDTLSVFGSKVTLMPPPGFGSAAEKGQKVAQALGKGRAVVWSHGNVVVGKTIEEACVYAFALEWEAQRQLFVTLLGGKPESVVAVPDATDQVDWFTKLGFQYFEAMDRGPRKEVDGRLFWR